MSPLISAIVIDDHPLVARGIADFLQSSCGFTQVDPISNIDDVFNHIHSNQHISLIVLDFWLPDGASLSLLARLKNEFTSTPILVISADDDLAVQTKVEQAEAHGFINKQAAPDIFKQAVTALLNKKTWFKHNDYRNQPKVIEISAEELGLTARQGEVLSLILRGMPNKRIAQVLSLSEQTIKEHVSGILNRLGVKNRIEAITKLRGKKFE